MSGILQIGPNATATLVVGVGDGSTLINNTGPATVYFGDDNSINANDATGVVPVASGGYITVDGTRDFYACVLANTSASLTLISGGLNFFSPASLSGLGGIKLFVQTTTPTQPPIIPLNSIWFNTTTNALEYWNGAAWVVQAFAGNQLIQAGTIVANLIAAGVVVAGIVNGTTITGSTFVVQNSSGATLIRLDSTKDALYLYADTGSATQGALLASLGASANTDPLDATSYPQGMFTQQLTLAGISSPTSFSGGSVLYSASGTGRLRFLSQSGVDNVLQRANVNMSQFTQGNSTTPAIIGAPLNYAVNEGSTSSEFEIEIDGVLTTSTVTANTLTFGLAVDGAILGAQVTIGASFLVINKTFTYTARFRLSVIGPGVSGTVALACEGSISQQGTNAGNTGINTPFNAESEPTSKTFDTTSAHTIQPYVSFGGLGASQSLTTYRTRTTRRD